MSKRVFRFFLVIVIILVLAGLVWRLTFQNNNNNPANSPTSTHPEQPIIVIPLAGPVSKSKAEISGMAWYNDTLILLPQFPTRFGPGDGVVFSLAKNDILAFLDGNIAGPLTPLEVPFFAPEIDKIDGFEGFEAIAFSDNQAYLTIEASPDKMMGYLILGYINPNLSELRLDPTSLIEIPPQAQMGNMTDESLLVTPDSILTFFEANGLKINPSPVVHSFSFTGEALGTLPLANLEYRLTDVTPLDSDNRFWGINYFFPGDLRLIPDIDTIVARNGEGATHSRSIAVERLVQFQYSRDGITITDTPPIQFQLLSYNLFRNWEAIAYLDQRGFLIASDKIPRTIFAFVSLPE